MYVYLYMYIYIHTHETIVCVFNRSCSPGLVIAGVERLIQPGSGAFGDVQRDVGLGLGVQGLGFRVSVYRYVQSIHEPQE